MNLLKQDIARIRKWEKDLKGVFLTSDLKNLFTPSSPVELYRRVGRLEEAGILARFCRGVYVVPDVNLEALSCRIDSKSCISFDHVLSRALLIGPIPQHRVIALRVGKNRRYQGPGGEVVHLGIQPELIFGCEMTNGIRRADVEKAYLDVLYFHLRGRRFGFDPYSDINIEGLNKERIRAYLERYQNPRFVQFVKNRLKVNHEA